MDNLNLRSILNQPSSYNKSGYPLYQLKAFYKYSSCRTAQLGGHAQYCDNDHLNGVWYNSCKQRGCPQCQNKPSEDWLNNTRNRLLNCPHHHIIFTLPSELHVLWQYNRAAFSDVLFEAAHSTLKRFYNDARYLAAQPGILGALHTWGRDLSLHPHIHFLVSHGGLNKNNDWVEPKKAQLFPQKPVMLVFRGILLSLLRERIKTSQWVIPPNETLQRLLNLTNFLGRKLWVVHFCKRYDTARGVAQYLARYVKKGPINNTQFRSAELGHVRFQYKSHQTKRIEAITFNQEDFVRRLSQHIPIPGKPGVRYSGLYSASGRKRLNIARKLLGQSEVPALIALDWELYLEMYGTRPTCRECGLPLEHREAVYRRQLA